MENQNPVSLLGSFLFKALALFIELERFLTSFDALRAYLSVTLLARFTKIS